MTTIVGQAKLFREVASDPSLPDFHHSLAQRGLQKTSQFRATTAAGVVNAIAGPGLLLMATPAPLVVAGALFTVSAAVSLMSARGHYAERQDIYRRLTESLKLHTRQLYDISNAFLKIESRSPTKPLKR